MSHSVLSRNVGVPQPIALRLGASEVRTAPNKDVWVLDFPFQAATLETPGSTALLFDPDDSFILDT